MANPAIRMYRYVSFAAFAAGAVAHALSAAGVGAATPAFANAGALFGIAACWILLCHLVRVRGSSRMLRYASVALLAAADAAYALGIVVDRAAAVLSNAGVFLGIIACWVLLCDLAVPSGAPPAEPGTDAEKGAAAERVSPLGSSPPGAAAGLPAWSGRAAEIGRALAESERALAEGERARVESERARAESERVRDEFERVLAEFARARALAERPG